VFQDEADKYRKIQALVSTRIFPLVSPFATEAALDRILTLR
jgi:hypothetical protein